MADEHPMALDESENIGAEKFKRFAHMFARPVAAKMMTAAVRPAPANSRSFLRCPWSGRSHRAPAEKRSRQATTNPKAALRVRRAIQQQTEGEPARESSDPLAFNDQVTASKAIKASQAHSLGPLMKRA
jgi:hypothetical protein